MRFWHDLQSDGPGFSLDGLSAAELAEVRGFVTAQYAAGLTAHDPAFGAAAAAAGIARYHTLVPPAGFDHETFWAKGRRVLPAATAPAFERMGFFTRIRAALPSAGIYADDLMWRVVRPHRTTDIGPVHADKWFWDAGNGDMAAGLDRLKVWVALYTAPGLNGLTVKPHSHATDRWKWHAEFKHGKMKPVLDEREEDLKMELLPLASGDMVLFHDGLLHGGAVNRADTCRVSLEMTVLYPLVEGQRLTAARRAA